MLFVVTAVLFVIGTQSESDEHNESTEAQATDTDTDAGEDAEAEEGEEGAGHDESTEAAGDDEAGEKRTILGVDPESTGAIALGVSLSVLIAAALWFRPMRPVAIAAAAFGAGFAVLDVLEVTHQLDEDRTNLALLAAVALGHAAAALAAGRLATLAAPTLEEP